LKLPIERLRKAFRLPPAERLILGQAWALFLLVELALRILPFKRLLALYHRMGARGRREPIFELPLPRLVWLVEVAGRHAPVNATCLKKALVLSWLLGRRGIRTELRIGVARDNGSLKGHAWLLSDGQAILGHQEIERHERLLPAGARDEITG